MIRIGITGGIGSGKTTICKIFEQLGAPVYEADHWAKTLTNTDTEIKKQLFQQFGEDLFNENGLDRNKLAEIIFNDSEALNKVNQIIHPKVIDHFNEWCKQHENKKYVIQEAAVLFESGFYKSFNKMITVSAPVELRIERIRKRNSFTRGKTMSIINNQWTDEEREKVADYIIVNDEKQSVMPQVLKIHEELSK
jgi:dephospho-CoA kinase